MAEKISVEIALDGGDEVERQLADMGEAGKKTFGDLQSSADQLDFSGVSDQFKTVATAIDTAQTAVKSAAGFESIIQGVKNVEGAFETLGVAATKMATRMTRSLGLVGVALRAIGPVGIAVGAVGGALLKFGNDAAEAINQANASAAKLGLTFQQFDALSRGLQQAGISSDAASAGFDHLKSAGLNVAQALPQIIAQLQAMPDGVNRTNTAISLLGEKLGVEVVAALRTGSLAANQFNATLSKTTEEQRNNAALQQQSLNKLSAAWNEFKADVATPIAIPLFGLIKTGLDQITQGINTTKQEWAALAKLLTQITPKVGIDISLTGSLQPQLDAAAKKLDEIKQKGVQAAQEPTIAFTAWGQAIQTVGGQGAAAGQQVSTAAVSAGQAVQQGVQIWTQWGTAASQAGDTAAAGVNKATQAASQPIPATSWSTWASNAATAVDTILAKLKELLGLSQQVKPLAGGAPIGSGGIGSNAAGGLLGGRGTGTSDSNLAWVSRGEYVMPARVVRQPGVASFLEAMRRNGNIPGFAAGGSVGGSTADVVGRIISRIDETLQSFMNAFNAIDAANDAHESAAISIAKAVIDAQRALNQSLTGIQQTMLPAMRKLEELMSGRFARGGLLGGRGSGTSDSNLAWVSRGEHIMPARAVAQPGVLAFLEALRRSGGNLGRVLDGMGRFALGGMVPRMPAFAAGGSVGSMSHVTIAFPGLPEISGLRASSGVVDQLQRAAALAQVRSGGRKPSRYS